MSKFDSRLAERLYEVSLDGGQDADTGNVDELGWYARFDTEQAILCEDSQGFVTVTTFATEGELTYAWNELVESYRQFDISVD